jgi:hypothetical protein
MKKSVFDISKVEMTGDEGVMRTEVRERVKRVKSAKRTLKEQEMAETASFFDDASEAKAKAKAHLKFLAELEVGDVEGSDHSVSVDPSVLNKPLASLNLVGESDDAPDAQFLDEHACAFFRIGFDLISVPYHAFENCAIATRNPNGVIVKMTQGTSYAPTEVYADVVYASEWSDSVILRVDSVGLHMPIWPVSDVRTKTEAFVHTIKGVGKVYLEPIDDRMFISAHPDKFTVEEGFSGIPAIANRRVVAVLYGATPDRSTLVWIVPGPIPVSMEILARWATSGGEPALIPLTRRRKVKRMSDEDYARMSGTDRAKMRRDKNFKPAGYYFEEDVSVYSDEYSDDEVYDAGFGIWKQYTDDFDAQPLHVVGNRFKQGKGKGKDLYGETLVEFSKKKKLVKLPAAAVVGADDAKMLDKLEEELVFSKTAPDADVVATEGNPFEECVLPAVCTVAVEEFGSAVKPTFELPWEEVEAPKAPTTILTNMFPNMARSYKDAVVVVDPKVVDLPSVSDPEFVKKAKEVKLTTEIREINSQIRAAQARGVCLHKIVQLSEIEMSSLTGLNLQLRLAQKTLKEYTEREKIDTMMKEKRQADAKKFEKAQKAIDTMTKQMMTLQERIQKYNGDGNFEQ